MYNNQPKKFFVFVIDNHILMLYNLQHIIVKEAIMC